MRIISIFLFMFSIHAQTANEIANSLKGKICVNEAPVSVEPTDAAFCADCSSNPTQVQKLKKVVGAVNSEAEWQRDLAFFEFVAANWSELGLTVYDEGEILEDALNAHENVKRSVEENIKKIENLPASEDLKYFKADLKSLTEKIESTKGEIRRRDAADPQCAGNSARAIACRKTKALWNRFGGGIDTIAAKRGFDTCGMSKAELLAIYLYTGDGYKILNSVSSEQREKIKPFVQTLTSALKKISPYKNEVHRGVDLSREMLKKYDEGKVVTLDRFTSTSISYGFDKNTRITIRSKSGRYIAPFSKSFDESEVLFAPGAKFKVLQKKQKGFLGWGASGGEILLEEVD